MPFVLYIVAGVFLSSIDGATLTNLNLAQIGGSLISHKMLSSFDEAKQKCQEEGAVLASPVTDVLRRELQTLFKNTPHFIGLDARFQQNTFVSVKGVPFDEMPVLDMYDSLDLDEGQCLYMTARHIRVVQCTARMPYVCYKIDANGTNVNTRRIPEGYTYYESTGSSYKVYTQMKTWDDASATCEADNAHLIVIDDVNEAQLLEQIYPNRETNPHIGIRDFEKNGNWKSVTGKQINEIYHIWQSGRPTCCYCGFLQPSGKIDDFGCNERRQFICEI